MTCCGLSVMIDFVALQTLPSEKPFVVPAVVASLASPEIRHGVSLLLP